MASNLRSHKFVLEIEPLSKGIPASAIQEYLTKVLQTSTNFSLKKLRRIKKSEQAQIIEAI